MNLTLFRSVRKRLFRRLQTRNIPLDRLLTGGFAEREHRLLRDSPHVAFLREFGEADDVDPERFRQSPYYEHALGDIARSGSFFGIDDPDRIIEQARYFHALHRAIRDGIPPPPPTESHRPGDLHSADPLPRVARVRGRRYFVIKDGHHRCAIHYVLGRRTIRARVIGRALLSAHDLDSILRAAGRDHAR